MKQPPQILKLTYFLIALILFAVLPACSATNPSDSHDAAPEDSATVSATGDKASPDGAATQNTEGKPAHDCTQGSEDPMCRPVLVGGEGDSIVMGTTELRGSFQIEYYPDGKVAKLLRFDAAHPDRPRWAKTLTYDDAGQIETVTIEEDDNVEKAAFNYDEGVLQSETGTKKNPSQPSVPMRITQKKYQDMTPDHTGSVYTEADLNHVQVQEDTYKNKSGASNYELVKRSEWSAAIQALELKSAEVNYSRRDSATNSKIELYAYCDASVGITAACDPFNSNFTKQYTVTAYYQYQGGKLTTALTGIDGDKNDLANNVSDGINDRNIECSINYEENNQREPYPLPEEVKMGLSGKEMVKSIECSENGQAKSTFNFHYEPLWKALESK